MSTISRYLELIPAHNHSKLDEELDYDNDVDRDLTEIAHYFIKWEELQAPLELTEEDVHLINEEQRGGKLRQ